MRSNVLFPWLAGYGAQFNNHLYAPITQPWMPPERTSTWRRRSRSCSRSSSGSSTTTTGRRTGTDAPRVARELRVVRQGRAARPRDRGDDRHLVPEPRQHRGPTLSAPRGRDGQVRRRARGPGQEPPPDERPLGDRRQRAERRVPSRSSRSTRSTGRSTPSSSRAASTARSSSWAAAWSRTPATRRATTTTG